MHIYARTEVITNVRGRADYVSNPNRQEHLLAVSGIQDKAYWRQLAEDSQAAWLRAGGNREKKAREAREIHVQLPKDILDLTPEEQQKVADQISELFQEKMGIDNLVGLHLSKTDGNVHAHILFPERQRLPEPEIRRADRNVFLDEAGKRRRTKKEILDADGQLRSGCRIVSKGEILYSRYFGDSDPIFGERAWLHGVKQDLADWINETLQPDRKREVFDPAGPYLAQVKIGKGRPADQVARIRKYNEYVKAFNILVQRGAIAEEQARSIKTQVMLSPDRMQALGAALHMERRNTNPPTNERSQGGVRTHQGPEEAKKRELRALFREAASYRKKAKEAKDSVERKIFSAEARKCSARIDRLKRELGYFTDEDYARRQRQIDAELRRRHEYLTNQRAKMARLARRATSMIGYISYLERQYYDLPLLLLTPEQKRRKAELEGLIESAKDDLDDVLTRKIQAKMAYRQAKKEAKERRIELRQERRELREEQKKRKPTTIGDGFGRR